jgi:hypothetical protein
MQVSDLASEISIDICTRHDVSVNPIHNINIEKEESSAVKSLWLRQSERRMD